MKRFAGLLLGLLIPFLGGWTVISRDELTKLYDANKKPELNAVEYLEKGILPYAQSHAFSVLDVLQATEQDFDKACKQYGFRHSAAAFPCNFWLEVKGTIVKIDSKSQSGRAWVLPDGVAANPSDEEAGTIVLMIGPAIDSMGPRDGYPDLKYEQFNDQTTFGAFGREINSLLSKYIQGKVATMSKGTPVHIVGVLSTWDVLYTNAEIVPVIFKDVLIK